MLYVLPEHGFPKTMPLEVWWSTDWMHAGGSKQDRHWARGHTP